MKLEANHCEKCDYCRIIKAYVEKYNIKIQECINYTYIGI